MSICGQAQLEQFGPLKTANQLLGDRDGLRKAWEEHGYWYFEGVLDKHLIADMRKVWIDYLQRKGLIDRGVDENRYNGAPVEDDLYRIEEFNTRELHKMLTENSKVNALMRQILGDEPFWLPICEYRANAPIDDPAKDRFIYPHQDGFYSQGMALKTCWIPVDSIDLDTGGCVWAEGVHRGPILHDINQPPLFPIPPERLPMTRWKAATFEPGDIVVFDLNTPHCGLTNVSKAGKFRMSLDIRVTEASGTVPTIGKIVSLSEQVVSVRNGRTGKEETYAVTPDTYVRNTRGFRRLGKDIPTAFQPDETIIVNSLDGRTATLVRAIH